MRHKWRFFGYFALYALVLSVIWFKLHAAYIHIPVVISDWILGLVGYGGDVVIVAVRESKTYVRFPEYAPQRAYLAMNMVFNLVPFFALVLATPRITLMRIVEVLGYGLAAMIVLHILSIMSVFFRVATDFFWNDVVYYFFATLLEALSPLILWFVFIGREFLFLRQ